MVHVRSYELWGAIHSAFKENFSENTKEGSLLHRSSKAIHPSLASGGLYVSESHSKHGSAYDLAVSVSWWRTGRKHDRCTPSKTIFLWVLPDMFQCKAELISVQGASTHGRAPEVPNRNRWRQVQPWVSRFTPMRRRSESRTCVY